MMKRFFVLSLILTLAVSAWADNDKVASNQVTVWEFSGQTKDATVEETILTNGLYIKAKASSSMKYSQVKRSGTFSDGSAWTTTTDNANGMALYLASNSNLTPTTSYFSDLSATGTNRTFRAVAFETAIAGKICAAVYVGSATSGSINLYKVASEENVVASINVAEDLSSNKTATLEYEATGTGIFVFGSKDANTTLCYMKFVPEAVTVPTINNSDGTITITAGASNLTGEGNVIIKTFYTTDGSDPTTESTEYTGSFELTSSCTVKTVSINMVTGTASSVASEVVTIAPPVVTTYTISGASESNGIAVDKTSATEGEKVTITMSVPEGYQLTGGKPTVMNGETSVEVSAVEGQANKFEFTMPAGDVIVSAAFELVNYPITYSGLDGASMTGMNPESYTIETETFTLINPTKEGSVFAGWTGTGLTEATTTVTITKGSTGARSYTATWTEPAAPTTHTLTVNVDDASHGSVAITVGGVAANSGDAVAEGASVTLTATANSGFTFKNWGSEELTTNPYTFEMGTSDVSLTATFEETPSVAEKYVSAAKTWTFNDLTTDTEYKTYTEIGGAYLRTTQSGRSFKVTDCTEETLTFSSGVSATVSKYLYVNNNATYNGGEGTLTAASTAGDGGTAGRGMIAINATLPGTFYAKIAGATTGKVIRLYFADGSNIKNTSVTSDGTIQEISYTSTSAGSFFVGGITTGTSNIYAIRFAPTRTVSIGSMSNGSVLADKSTAEEGETISLTVNPASGYELETLSVNGTAIEGTSFTMPDADVTVTATFKELPASNYSISLAEGVTGVSFDKASAAAGDKVTITVTVLEGYQLTGGKPTVMSGETSVVVSAVEGQANKFEFTMPAGDVTVTAGFEAITYTITYSGLDGASMTGTNPESYTIETETFTLINPTKEGSVFAGWTGTGLTEATTTVTITKGSTGARSYTATWTDEQQEETEEYVSAATTWTFNSQETGEITSRKVIDKLYARVVSGRSYTFEALGTAQPLTFSDGASTQVSVEKVATGTGTISYNAKIKTANDSPSGSSNDMTPSFAFNTTVKGTVYVFLQEVGETHNSSYRQRIYFGDGSSAVTSQYSKEGAKALGVEEIKWTSSTAGTFVVGSTTSLSKIYAIRFVPTRSITISDAIEHGTVIADKSEGGMGDVVTLTVTPSTGYELESISVNGTAIEGTSFSMPDADVTVMATFKAVDYIVTVTQPTGGEVKVSVAGGVATSSNTTAQYGQTITLSNTPSGGYTFSLYSVTKTSGGEAVTVTDGSFTMPAEAVTVTAIFAEKSKTDISGAVVTLSATSFTYDGSTHAPEVTKVTLNGTDLTLGTDYTVNTIESQTNVGAYTVTVTGTGNYTGTATAGWTIKRNLGVTLDGTQQWATYFSAEDLAKPEGVTVYRVTGVADHVVNTEQVSYIKAGVGVLLYSETAVDAEKWIVGPDSGEDYTSTLLGSVEAGTMAAGTNYVLYNNQFMLAEDNILPANHCYLQISGVSGARGLTIEHGDDNTTGIHTTPKDHGNMINDEYYTLSGQRVEKPTKKGLYIVNGRKVVIK